MRTRSHWENAKNPFFVIIFAYFWWAKIGDLGHTATVWGCSRDLRRVYKLEPSKSARFAQKLDVLDVFGYERNLTLKQYLVCSNYRNCTNFLGPISTIQGEIVNSITIDQESPNWTKQGRPFKYRKNTSHYQPWRRLGFGTRKYFCRCCQQSWQIVAKKKIIHF